MIKSFCKNLMKLDSWDLSNLRKISRGIFQKNDPWWMMKEEQDTLVKYNWKLAKYDLRIMHLYNNFMFALGIKFLLILYFSTHLFLLIAFIYTELNIK